MPVSLEVNKRRIIGGVESLIEDYPYQISVRLKSYTLLHICGGSIYSPRVVITAAHCIKGRYSSHILVIAGKSSIEDQEPAIKSTKLILNDGYNKKTHFNDIGLIILAESLIYSSSIQPIPLAFHKPPVGTIACVSGWGKNDENAEFLQNNLQTVQLKIIDPDYCNSQYSARKLVITDEMVCAGVDDYSKDSCQGDSGGPLVVQGELVGIVSWGNGCARNGFPGVYSSVSYHMQWILDQAEPYM
ncbi:hypothetical protein DOY81_001949 [Sarcophaga bullata]|nr:hypothetical protein DOY81_001949 [Sarcophaga bullata]